MAPLPPESEADASDAAGASLPTRGPTDEAEGADWPFAQQPTDSPSETFTTQIIGDDEVCPPLDNSAIEASEWSVGDGDSSGFADDSAFDEPAFDDSEAGDSLAEDSVDESSAAPPNDSGAPANGAARSKKKGASRRTSGRRASSRSRDRGAPPPAAHAAGYAITDLLGRGGFGEVRLAVQKSLAREIAVKRPHTHTPEAADADTSSEALTSKRIEVNFHQEALITGNLEHPNIVPVHDLGHDDAGHPLLAMKRVRGTPWHKLIWDDEQLPFNDFLARHLSILIDVAQAVAFAHSRGIVHRDIKPRQILVGEFGEVVVTDWGLAMVYDVPLARKEVPYLIASSLAPTPDTALNPAGTPAYMAPEQTERTAAHVGPWTDVFLLGGTLFYLLTGTPPFPGREASEAFAKARAGRIPDPRERAPDRDIPDELARLCLRATAPNIERRLASAKLFIANLRDYLSGAGQRRESQEIIREIEPDIDTEIKRTRLSYTQLTQARMRLGRALQLWPHNPDAERLRRELLIHHTKRAIGSADLQLAASLLETLPESESKSILRNSLEERRARLRQEKRQRLQFLWTSVVLVFVLIVGVISFSAYSTKQNALLLEAARRQAADADRRAQLAERAQYASDLKFAALRLEAGEREEAQQILLAVPPQRRGFEWGILVARCYPELLTLEGHRGTVTAIDIDAAGERLLTAAEDGILKTWNLSTGSELWTQAAHSGRIAQATYSPVGDRIVTLGADTSGAPPDHTMVRLWEASTGIRLGEQSWPAHQAAFSPDGRRIALACGDSFVRLWTPETGNVVALKGHTAPVRAVCFDSSGKLLLSGADDNAARLWSVETGDTLSVLEGHYRPLEKVEFSPGDTLALTIASDRAPRLWNTVTGAHLNFLTGHTGDVLTGGFSPDGSKVVTAGKDRTARIWDTRTSFEHVRLIGHRAEINNALFSPDGHLVATTSRDGTARLWSVATGREIAALTHKAASSAPSPFTPDGTRLVTASEVDAVQIWAGRGQPEEWRWTHEGEVSDVVFSPDGNSFITTSYDQAARVWDVETGGLMLELRGHDGPVSGAAYAPDGRRVATASFDGTAIIWDIATGRAFRSIKAHQAEVTSVAYSPDGRRLVTASFDKTAAIWDAESGELIRRLEGHAGPLHVAAFSPKGDQILTGSEDKTAVMWDAATGRRLRTLEGHTRGVTAVAFDPTGRLLLTGSSDRRLRLWEAATGSEIAWLLGHDGAVLDAAFTPDGSRVVSASQDHTIRVWDAATGLELIRMEPGSSPVNAIALDATGRRLLSASAGGIAKLWGTLGFDMGAAAAISLEDPEQRAAWESAVDKVKRARYATWMRRLATSRYPPAFTRLRHLLQSWRQGSDVGAEIVLAARSLLAEVAQTDDPRAPAQREELEALVERLGALKRDSNDPGANDPPPDIDMGRLELLLDGMREPVAFDPTVEGGEDFDFSAFIKGAEGPLPVHEQRQIAPGTPLKILCFIRGDEERGIVLLEENSVFIAGDLPEFAEWQPSQAELTRVRATPVGEVWQFEVPFRPMEFKFTYGRRGQGWDAGEWWGVNNRSLPRPGAQLYRMPDGELRLLCEFGKEPYTP